MTSENNQKAFDADKAEEVLGDTVAFDVFKKLARAEWDTLMFFYGVILCVGGLGFIGYLGMKGTSISGLMPVACIESPLGV